MSGCKGCGVPLTSARSGRPRVWCSEKCRKRQYDRICSRCGGRASGTDPGRTRTDFCLACLRLEQHEISVAWLVAEAHHWFDLYGEQPAAYEWHLSNMRWQTRTYLEGNNDGRFSDATIAEVERRHSEDGPWPNKNAVQNTFGSWSAFIAAAGFEPLSPGRKRSLRQAVAA